jgi:hypothetical protein
MPVIICQFCQRENKSGTRFCTECGCSIHLKICPNPDCGKISNVEATVCESCGQPFPKVPLVPFDTQSTTRADEALKHDESSGGTSRDRPRSSAWPLIMMAIVAGGLPLLWANRSQLPTPSTWKINASDSAKSGGAAPAPGQLNSLPSLKIAPPVIPMDPVNAAPSPPSTPAPTAIVSDTPGAVQGATKDTASVARNPPEKGNTPKKTVKTSQAKTKESPPPCTEATAALGLCNPTQAPR